MISQTRSQEKVDLFSPGLAAFTEAETINRLKM